MHVIVSKTPTIYLFQENANPLLTRSQFWEGYASSYLDGDASYGHISVQSCCRTHQLRRDRSTGRAARRFAKRRRPSGQEEGRARTAASDRSVLRARAAGSGYGPAAQLSDGTSDEQSSGWAVGRE